MPHPVGVIDGRVKRSVSGFKAFEVSELSELLVPDCSVLKSHVSLCWSQTIIDNQVNSKD